VATVNKTEAIRAVISHTADGPLVFTTGYTCRIAQRAADRENHFYMTGSMGLAASIGLGVGLASGVPVVIVDGDGSIAMNTSALVDIGNVPELPITHLVLDDGRYDSTGGQTVPTANLDLVGLASAVGYRHVERIENLERLNQTLASLDPSAGTRFVHCVLQPDPNPVPPRVNTALPDVADRFAKYLADRAARSTDRQPDRNHGR
jgi:thiamine pyrophosphate-dependent acetolactate synthase large subunit-like protein